MRIASGITDQYIYFKAVLSTSDPRAGVSGLSGFTVYRSRNGGTPVAMTSPTIVELDAANLPGRYALLLDEDMTIGAGNDTEEMLFTIKEAGMDDFDRTIELYRPKLTEGYTATVDSNGRMDVGLIEGSDATDQINAAADAAIADAALATAAALATVDSNVDAILVDTGTDIPAALGAIAGYIDTEVAAIKTVTDNLPDSGALTSIAQASALATAQADLDTLTGADGATLATSQPNYAPSTHSAANVRTEMDANSTQLAAIKAKTDGLTYDVAGYASVNIKYVNDVAVTGTGAGGDEWGPA